MSQSPKVNWNNVKFIFFIIQIPKPQRRDPSMARFWLLHNQNQMIVNKYHHMCIEKKRVFGWFYWFTYLLAYLSIDCSFICIWFIELVVYVLICASMYSCVYVCVYSCIHSFLICLIDLFTSYFMVKGVRWTSFRHGFLEWFQRFQQAGAPVS